MRFEVSGPRLSTGEEKKKNSILLSRQSRSCDSAERETSRTCHSSHTVLGALKSLVFRPHHRLRFPKHSMAFQVSAEDEWVVADSEDEDSVSLEMPPPKEGNVQNIRAENSEKAGGE